MTTETVFRSDARPDFEPFEESCGTIKGFTYARRPGLRCRGGHAGQGGRARPARRHAGDPRDGGDDRPPPLRRRLRAPPRLRLPRPHARVHRPGGVGRRRLVRPAHHRQRDQLPPRARRRDREGLLRPAPDDRRAAAGADGGGRRRDPRRAPGRGARGAPVQGDRRAVRQGRGLQPGPRWRHAHRRLLHRQPGRQRHRRRLRADRDRRRDGPPLREERHGRVLLRGRRRLRERRGPRVAQLGGPAPVDQPPRRRPPVRPADHLLHPEQPLRHDPPDRRGGHGRPGTWPAAPPGSRPTTCMPRWSTAWTCSRSATP